MTPPDRRTVLGACTALATGGLAGCATVRKELGMVDEGDVIEKRGHLYRYGGSPSDLNPPDHENGLWIRFRNEHDRFVVAEAVYDFTVETDAGTIVEDVQRVENFAPGDTETWYYDLTESETDAVTSYGWSPESFELA